MKFSTPYLKSFLVSFLFLLISITSVYSQQLSTARVWNEMVLQAIRNDNARPTVHARNLFHTSLAMYDAWAAFDDINETYLLGKTVGNFTCPFSGIPAPSNLEAARIEAMSYAVYRLIHHRFEDSPGYDIVELNTDIVFGAFGFNPNFMSTDYASGSPAALGNYIAEQIIAMGNSDGSNEINDYKNQYYEPINPNLNPSFGYFNPATNFGNERMIDANRWQPLEVLGFVDQSGNLITDGSNLKFLGAEWGNVTPFALTDDVATTYERDGNNYKVYLDAGAPALLDTLSGGDLTDNYKWGFSLVASWKTHILADGVTMDISPNSIGNNPPLPTTLEGLKTFYDFTDGGDSSMGHTQNPSTGQPYQTQDVLRQDYTRVLAEFWADGPSSETPPGHWFTILNYINDHPDLIKKYKGDGVIVDDLEWDVKAYFTLGGAMHDAAIAAWSNKGYYDYLRPISALRFMMDRGQCTDPDGSDYDINGIPLLPGIIDTVGLNDPLLAPNNSNLGMVKYKSSVGGGNEFWTMGTLWRPYQAANFVTPPFAGYVSGHSTFSRAAAEVLTRFTGDAFFPGGMGEFFAEKNNFLNFEPGPSEDITLQWATYQDAADQSGLSRIWGGIHPPCDDIPGRLMGIEVGNRAFDLADDLFGAPVMATSVNNINTEKNQFSIFPNPWFANNDLPIQILFNKIQNQAVAVTLFNTQGQALLSRDFHSFGNKITLQTTNLDLPSGVFYIRLQGDDWEKTKRIVIIENR